MKYGWLDSHAHLAEEELYTDIEGIITRAETAGLIRIMAVCVNTMQAERMLALQKRYPLIDVAAGFHPEDVDNITENDWLNLEVLLQSGKLAAVGEIGLDYYWVKDNKEKQKELFGRQLEMAAEYDLPVLIHMRDSSQDTYDLLKKQKLKRAGIMHCYGGSIEMASLYMDLGFYISIAGPVTFKNAHNVKEMATAIPLDKILIETDSPYLTPVPFRGKTNEPANVIYTGQEICRLKGISAEVLQENICLNYQRLLKIVI